MSTKNCTPTALFREIQELGEDQGGQLVQEVQIEWPLSPSQRLPPKLASKYLDQSARVFARTEPNRSLDSIDIWQTKIEFFLNQLAREIAFPEEDLARRFENLRSQIRHNARINSQPVYFVLLP